MKPLIVLKVGDTFKSLAAELGDFEHWVIERLLRPDLPVQVVDPRKGDTLPEPAEIAGAIVTGSHAMVTDREPWSEATAEWLRQAVPTGLPILGICYGHQLLAHAFGGKVGYHPAGIEIGTVDLTLGQAAEGDQLFSGMPKCFGVQVVHQQTVLSLPNGAIVLGCNDHEPHHAFRIGDRAWGVQFHPEFSAEAMVGTIREDARDLQWDEARTQAVLRTVQPTPESASLLQRFADIAYRHAN